MNDKSRKHLLFEEKPKLMPEDGQKMTITNKAKIMILATVILNGPFIIGSTGYMTKGLLEGLRNELLLGIYCTYTWFLVLIIMFLWLYRADEIGNFLVANDTFNFGVPRSIVTKVWIFTSWNNFALIGVNLIHFVQVILNKIYCLGEKYKNREFCEFGLPLWYPMETDSVLVKAYIYLSIISVPLFYTQAASMFLIIGESAFKVVSRIRHLAHHFKYIEFGENVDSDLEKLRFCIRYNTEIVRLVSYLNRTLGLLLFPEYTLLIGMLSLLEYEIIFMHRYFCIFAFIQWFYGPVIFCELGDLMNEEYEKLRWAVYSMNWYEMRPELRKTYLLLLGSVQNPVTFKAQPIAALNRECLLKIVKGSYSFLMFLGRFTDRN